MIYFLTCISSTVSIPLGSRIANNLNLWRPFQHNHTLNSFFFIILFFLEVLALKSFRFVVQAQGPFIFAF